MSIDNFDRRVWVWESISSFLLFKMMVDGVNGVPTNPYAAMSQLSGLAEVIVDFGRKATPHQATVGDPPSVFKIKFHHRRRFRRYAATQQRQ
jgi:hypothetical protein